MSKEIFPKKEIAKIPTVLIDPENPPTLVDIEIYRDSLAVLIEEMSKSQPVQVDKIVLSGGIYASINSDRFKTINLKDIENIDEAKIHLSIGTWSPNIGVLTLHVDTMVADLATRGGLLPTDPDFNTALQDACSSTLVHELRHSGQNFTMRLHDAIFDYRITIPSAYRFVSTTLLLLGFGTSNDIVVGLFAASTSVGILTEIYYGKRAMDEKIYKNSLTEKDARLAEANQKFLEFAKGAIQIKLK